jgi:hypothetical protein
MKKVTRREVAEIYSTLIDSNAHVDYSVLNRWIIQTWSMKGLEYIKELAWSGKL